MNVPWLVGTVVAAALLWLLLRRRRRRPPPGRMTATPSTPPPAIEPPPEDGSLVGPRDLHTLVPAVLDDFARTFDPPNDQALWWRSMLHAMRLQEGSLRPAWRRFWAALEHRDDATVSGILALVVDAFAFGKASGGLRGLFADVATPLFLDSRDAEPLAEALALGGARCQFLLGSVYLQRARSASSRKKHAHFRTLAQLLLERSRDEPGEVLTRSYRDAVGQGHAYSEAAKRAAAAARGLVLPLPSTSSAEENLSAAVARLEEELKRNRGELMLQMPRGQVADAERHVVTARKADVAHAAAVAAFGRGAYQRGHEDASAAMLGRGDALGWQHPDTLASVALHTRCVLALEVAGIPQIYEQAAQLVQWRRDVLGALHEDTLEAVGWLREVSRALEERASRKEEQPPARARRYPPLTPDSRASRQRFPRG